MAAVLRERGRMTATMAMRAVLKDDLLVHDSRTSRGSKRGIQPFGNIQATK